MKNRHGKPYMEVPVKPRRPPSLPCICQVFTRSPFVFCFERDPHGLFLKPFQKDNMLRLFKSWLDESGGIPSNDRVFPYVPRHNASCSHDSAISDRYAGEDDCIGTDPDVPADHNR